MKPISTLLGIGAALLMFSPSSYASFITGSNLNITGLDNVAVNLEDIDFGYTGAVTPGNPEIATGTVTPTGTGPFLITPSSGSFSTLNGTDATVMDLCQGGTGCTTPVVAGTPVDITNFITFASNSWDVTLTLLDVGSGGLAGCAGTPGTGLAGQTCTPTGSPFTLSNLGNSTGSPATGVSITLDFQGTISDGTPSDTVPITGTFSTQFSGTDLQTVLYDVNNNETIAASDSGNLTIEAATTTPEPGSFLLAGLGGVLLGLGMLQRKARS